jgi:hypothetical protein
MAGSGYKYPPMDVAGHPTEIKPENPYMSFVFPERERPTAVDFGVHLLSTRIYARVAGITDLPFIYDDICRGEIYYAIGDDAINLKSPYCRYLENNGKKFVAVAGNLKISEYKKIIIISKKDLDMGFRDGDIYSHIIYNEGKDHIMVEASIPIYSLPCNEANIKLCKCVKEGISLLEYHMLGLPGPNVYGVGARYNIYFVPVFMKDLKFTK